MSNNSKKQIASAFVFTLFSLCFFILSCKTSKGMNVAAFIVASVCLAAALFFGFKFRKNTKHKSEKNDL